MITLEIPCAPIPEPVTTRQGQNFSAKLVRVTNGEDCHLLGLKFARPLTQPTPKKSRSGSPSKPRTSAAKA